MPRCSCRFSLDYSTYVGRIGVGRVNQGTIKVNQQVAVYEGVEALGLAKVQQILKFDAWSGFPPWRPAPATSSGQRHRAGRIGVTITDPANPVPLPMLKIDEPTLTMNFCVNNSPLPGARQVRHQPPAVGPAAA